MKSKVSTEWSTISHPNRRARLSGNKTSNNKYVFANKPLKIQHFNDF